MHRSVRSRIATSRATDDVPSAGTGAGVNRRLLTGGTDVNNVRTLSVHGADIMTLARGSRKEDRLELRLEPTNRRLLDEAAAASSMSTSAFVLTHATQAAREVLADRTTFVLPDDRWDAFVQLLERKERPMSGLAAFLARPSVFDDE